MAEGTFQQHLKWQREIQGLTQAQLAKKAGLTPDWISHFEAGERIPSVPKLKALADALEVTMDYLWGPA